MLENKAQLAQLLEIAVLAEYVKVNDCDPTDNKGVLDPELHEGPGIFNVVAGDDYLQFTGEGLINGSWIGSQFHCKDEDGKLQVLTFLSAGKPLCPKPEPKQVKLHELIKIAVQATHVQVNDYDATENYSIAVPTDGAPGQVIMFLSPADENMVFLEEHLLEGNWIKNEFFCENERDAVRITFLREGEVLSPEPVAIDGYLVRINPDFEAEDGSDHFDTLMNALEHFEIPANVVEVKAVNPRAFTVISVDPATAQIYADHVEADTAMAAFTAATALHEDYNLDFVCAMNGHLSEGEMLFFPGSAVVDSETILEQPDVFC